MTTMTAMIVPKQKPNASTSASTIGPLRPYRGLYSSRAGPEAKLQKGKLLGLMREHASRLEAFQKRIVILRRSFRAEGPVHLAGRLHRSFGLQIRGSQDDKNIWSITALSPFESGWRRLSRHAGSPSRLRCQLEASLPAHASAAPTLRHPRFQPSHHTGRR